MAANVDLDEGDDESGGGVGENLTLLTTGRPYAAFSIDPVYAMHKADAPAC